MAKLLFNTAEGQMFHLELHPGRNRLGRNSSNDFAIEDPSVSGFHCELVLSENGALVTDLDSTNGTYIDGVPVKEAELQPGQTLELGTVKLLWEETPVEISIPDLTVPTFQAGPNFLDDGSPACLNHADKGAHFKCPKCETFFCDACVRVLRRAGGKTMFFCQTCGGPCEVMAPVRAPKKAKSFLGLLEKTLKLPFKRDRIDSP